MTATKLFYPAAMSLWTGGTPTETMLHQVGDLGVETNIEDLVEMAGGDYAPSFLGSSSWAPVMNLTTPGILAVLGECDDEAVASDISAAAEYIDVYFRAAKQNSFREAESASKHMVYRATANAMFFWSQIQAQQGQTARISVEAHTSYNGSNEPLVATKEQAITTAPIVENLYTLGPIVINGTTIDDSQSMTWANNVELEKVAADGEHAPSLIVGKSFAPRITIENNNLDTLQGYSLQGLAITSLSVYLRKRETQAMNYSDASTEHIKLTATKGLGRLRSVGGSPGAGTFEIQLERPSAGTAVFSVATGVAIT